MNRHCKLHIEVPKDQLKNVVITLVGPVRVPEDMITVDTEFNRVIISKTHTVGAVIIMSMLTPQYLEVCDITYVLERMPP